MNNKYYSKFQVRKNRIHLFNNCIVVVTTVSFRWLLHPCIITTECIKPNSKWNCCIFIWYFDCVVVWIFVYTFTYSVLLLCMCDVRCTYTDNKAVCDIHHIHIIRRITNGCKISTRIRNAFVHLSIYLLMYFSLFIMWNV